MKDLLELRNEIDEIDNQIVELYEKRMQVSAGVAEYKISTGKKVFDKERENQKLKTLSAKASSKFTEHGIKELFEQIMAMSRKKQYQLLTEHGVVDEEIFEAVDSIDKDNIKVVFQGLEGAYSHIAMKEFFGENCDSYAVDTWRDAMEAIKNHKADYAVLPIENSTAGIISENYDLLVEYENVIVAEQTIKVNHALLGLPGASKDELTHVFSHPQSLMQCNDYLEATDWEKVSMKNNAVAAKKIKDDGIITHGAIANRVNADIYGLEVLEDSIQDNKSNSTRFIIVTGQKKYLKSAKHMSISFEIPHESGSLYHVLSHFIYNNINMTNIQSRPIPSKNWEYRFFVDIEGNFNDTAVKNALRGLEEETLSLKILGTY